VTMKEAVGVTCLSPDHFVEIFRSAVGCTPHQYLLQRRLRHARQVIASEGHRRPLAEIALAGGRVLRPGPPDAPFSSRLWAEPRPVAATNHAAVTGNASWFRANGPQLSRFCSRHTAKDQIN
jgi:hypothetical protein